MKVIGLAESSYKKGEDKSVNTGVLTTVLTTISIRKLVTSLTSRRVRIKLL